VANKLAESNLLQSASKPKQSVHKGEIYMLTFILWLLLWAICWPLALLALVLWPIVWLISIPFRILGVAFDAVFAFLRALFFLPSRILGSRAQ